MWQFLDLKATFMVINQRTISLGENGVNNISDNSSSTYQLKINTQELKQEIGTKHFLPDSTTRDFIKLRLRIWFTDFNTKLLFFFLLKFQQIYSLRTFNYFSISFDSHSTSSKQQVFWKTLKENFNFKFRQMPQSLIEEPACYIINELTA